MHNNIKSQIKKLVTMKKRIIYSVCAIAFVALAAFNTIQVDNNRILIGQGSQIGDYTVTIANTELQRNALYVNNSTTYSAGGGTAIFANQPLIPGKNIAVSAFASSSSYVSTAQTYGVHTIAGNGVDGSNYGVFAGLKGSRNGAAVFGTIGESAISVPRQYAGFFNGTVYLSELVGIGVLHPSTMLDVNGSIRCYSVITTSDSHLKANVQGLKSSMELIEKLRPVTYNFKPNDYAEYYEILRDSGVLDSVVINNDDDLRKFFSLGEPRDVKRKHIGFIAQELREIFPDLVYEDKKGSLSIDYISLIPVLVGTIQEQNQNIQKLEDVIQSLSSRLDALEKNNKNLENLETVYP